MDVSLCVEWLKVDVTVGSLTEDNLEHCAVALYEELAQGHTVMERGHGSQHSFQLVSCGRKICCRGGRSWGGVDGKNTKGIFLSLSRQVGLLVT